MSLIAALKAKAAKTPPGEMVTRLTATTTLNSAAIRTGTIWIKPRPIIRFSISHASGHVIAVNSYVLKASGITKDTKDPPGGSFDRDPDGTPNGVIREAARRLLTRTAQTAGEPTSP